MSTRILIIEDNPDHVLLTKRILEKANGEYQMDSANEAKQGLSKVFRENYDLILCDFRMSSLSALDILMEMRKKGKDLPFIVVTASGNEKAAVELMREGAYDYVLKDLSYEATLPIVIKRAIDRYSIKKEKERVEEALRKSEERFKTLISNIPGATYQCAFDAQRTMEFISNEIETISGYPASDFMQNHRRTYNTIIHQEDRNIVKDTINKGVEQRKPYTIEYRIINADGSIHWVYERGQGVFNKKGNLFWLDGAIFDITERKKAEEALQASEKRYRELYESAPVSYFSISAMDGAILRCNNAAVNLLGYDRETIMQMKVFDLYADTNSGKSKALEIFNRFKTGESIHDVVLEMKHRDGHSLWIMLSVQSVRDERGNVFESRSMVIDITERKKAEERLQDAYCRLKQTQQQLIQSSKMAAVGQLAAGISHELNQPLTGIKGFAQAILLDSDENSPIRADLQKIIEQADRMDMIIKNVRLFARKSEFVLKELNINKPIEDALMLLNEQFKVHNILLKKSLAENLPEIQGDTNQLQQVFLNLLTNARDAIDSLKSPEGGEIVIKTCLSEDKRSVLITLADTGCGISRENLENIFNPFFTTKSPDGGVGLGLSIAYSIIENHRGSIEVVSRVGEGTAFKINLPFA